VSLCVIYKPQEGGGHSLRWATAPQGKKKKMLLCSNYHLHHR